MLKELNLVLVVQTEQKIEVADVFKLPCQMMAILLVLSQVTCQLESVGGLLSCFLCSVNSVLINTEFSLFCRFRID